MKTKEEVNNKDIIIDSLKNSIDYKQYRGLVKQLADENSTTGKEKTEALVNYTMLNDRRMKRWDKTIKTPQDIVEQVAEFKGNITWLVLTESWCGDAAHIIPVMNKLAELNDDITLKMVFRDENEALMNNFLTNGGKAIPKLIMIDNGTNEVLNTFGSRPSEATQLVNDYKAKHGKLTPEFKEDLQRWYNKDKGQATIKDLTKLLEK